ncbi:hypothetical protein NECAME_09775 [Necator americanus]|uniref:Uncharacterized protein n=1 Tax=Necator americanus TaxID=51031 RepID=W2TBV6_NECAM|nr:hypothetical protein NECAME_09775 [Necator americanus]ETN79535.1 hypothetical protein NECAME_09775 [Necator americanus]
MNTTPPMKTFAGTCASGDSLVVAHGVIAECDISGSKSLGNPQKAERTSGDKKNLQRAIFKPILIVHLQEKIASAKLRRES